MPGPEVKLKAAGQSSGFFGFKIYQAEASLLEINSFICEGLAYVSLTTYFYFITLIL